MIVLNANGGTSVSTPTHPVTSVAPLDGACARVSRALGPLTLVDSAVVSRRSLALQRGQSQLKLVNPVP